MDLKLRPGEALIWEWEDRGKFHGYMEKPPRMSNGRLVFEPDFESETWRRWPEEVVDVVYTSHAAASLPEVLQISR